MLHIEILLAGPIAKVHEEELKLGATSLIELLDSKHSEGTLVSMGEVPRNEQPPRPDAPAVIVRIHTTPQEILPIERAKITSATIDMLKRTFTDSSDVNYEVVIEELRLSHARGSRHSQSAPGRGKSSSQRRL